ncbi:MAG: hypothetical protein K2X66_16020, partial [Cyanobacteria bacterium]|nr:hypothetical protein [Cyanobacteriota bacterium]
MRPYYETWWFEWLFILVCCATGLFLWQMADHPFLETGQENASFVELAKSLVEGKGYTLLHTAEDAPYIQSPPVYPLMLAGLMTFAHQTDVVKMIHPFKVLNLALYLLSIVLVYSYFQKYIRKPYPFVVTALYAFAPMTLSVAGSITSEMAYMVFSMMAILAIDKYFPEKGVEVSKWQLFLCIFWVVASVLTRNIGFALLLAFFVIAFRTVGMKQAFLILAVCLVCLAPWFLREVYYKNYFPNQLAASGQNASLGLSSGGLSSGGPSTTSNPNNASGLTSPLSWSDPAQYFRQVVLNGEATLSDTTQNTLGVLNFDRFDSLVVNKLRL